MEADYSTALTLVLRYPSPQPPHLPATFVEDAIYLRNNLNLEGGRSIIKKYSNRLPTSKPPPTLRPRQAPQPQRALSTSGRIQFPAGQFESIVQDVAKNMLDRSEKWGVNRAVRDAVVEVRKNVHKPPIQRQNSTKEEALARQNTELLVRLRKAEERGRQLARILELGIATLEPDETSLDRLNHVKDCLLDDEKPLNKEFLQPSTSTPIAPVRPRPVKTPSHSRTSSATETPHSPRALVRKPAQRTPASPPGNFVKTSFGNNSDPDFLSAAERPRTTLAQSSFAWMLGDDPAEKNRSTFVAPVKRPSGFGSVDGVDEKQPAQGVAALSREGTMDSEEFDLGDLKK